MGNTWKDSRHVTAGKRKQPSYNKGKTRKKWGENNESNDRFTKTYRSR